MKAIPLGLISRIDFTNFQVVDEMQLKFKIDLTPMVNVKIGRLIGAKEGVGKAQIDDKIGK